VAPQLQAALLYAHLGLKVFPLRPGSKVPFSGSHGFKDATVDADQIRVWWQAAPGANIGLATGGLVDVIDIDGPEGVASWLALEDRPVVVGHVTTPRPQGHHLYIRATGDGDSTQLLPDIDYRGLGGYVVAPPSFFAGDTSHPYRGRYRWLDELQIVGGVPQPIEEASVDDFLE